MGRGRGDDPLPVILFFVGICVIGAISADIYALKSIWTIWSQRWVQNPGGCVVHGMWTEQHWRRVSCGRHSTCNEDFWQYHFEVSVVGKNWPRGEACYYASCANTEYDDADHACCESSRAAFLAAPAKLTSSLGAGWLNDLVDGACSDAGYRFDEGIFDIVDTSQTRFMLREGLTCTQPAEGAASPPPAPAALAPPPPPPPPAPPGGGYSSQFAGAGPGAAMPPPAPPGSQYGYSMTPVPTGPTVRGRPSAGPPCQCEASYPCWFNANSNNAVYPDLKMSAETDPVWYYFV